MIVKIGNKNVNLEELAAQLTSAGVSHRGVGVVNGVWHTYDVAGEMVPMPQAADAVLQAHVPSPEYIDYSTSTPIRALLRTQDATAKEIWRLNLKQRTGYAGKATIIGVDAGNGNVKVLHVTFSVKRLSGDALSIGTPVVLSVQQDAGASTWVVNAAIQDTAAYITVQGAAGRSIDWLVSGDMISFSPGGNNA
jgi:hypothetical protein